MTTVFFLMSMTPVLEDNSLFIKEQYNLEFIEFLHSLYGEGYLSEGNMESNKLLLGDLVPHRAEILDFGCGTGGVSRFISEHCKNSHIIGADLVDSCIESAKSCFPQNQYPNLDFVSSKSEKLPFPDQTFDWIFAKEVFIHISDQKNTLKQLYRILKPGGQLIIVDWLASSDDFSSHRDSIIQLSSCQEIERSLKGAGFAKLDLSDLSMMYKGFLERTLERLEAFSDLPMAQEYFLSLSKLLEALNQEQISVIRLQYEKPVKCVLVAQETHISANT